MAGKAKDELSPRAKAWIIGVLVVLVGWWALSSGSDSDDDERDLEFGAFDVCKQFVRDELKAPNTAVFRNYFEDDGEVRVFDSDPTYRVVSSVDSENSFGASLRTNFECTVTHASGDRWRLTNLVLDD